VSENILVLSISSLVWFTIIASIITSKDGKYKSHIQGMATGILIIWIMIVLLNIVNLVGGFNA
jgi:hypothetical protein